MKSSSRLLRCLRLWILSLLVCLGSHELLAADPSPAVDPSVALVKQLLEERKDPSLKPDVWVRRLQEAVLTGPESAKPLLRTVLAAAFWEYYQAHSWTWLSRTPLEGDDDSDF